MQVAFQAADGLGEHLFILAEHRSVAGQQPLDVAVADAPQRLDKAGNVAAVMSINRAHAAVAVDVVAGKQQVVEAKGKLAVGVAGRMPNFQLDITDRNFVAVVIRNENEVEEYWFSEGFDTPDLKEAQALLQRKKGS